MKANSIIAVSTLLMSSGLVLAAEAPAMPDGSTPRHEQMQKMQSQMAEIQQTEDSVKRDELIQAHMDSMGEMMKTMQDMHGDGKMMGKGGMMGKDGMMSKGKKGDMMSGDRRQD